MRPASPSPEAHRRHTLPVLQHLSEDEHDLPRATPRRHRGDPPALLAVVACAWRGGAAARRLGRNTFRDAIFWESERFWWTQLLDFTPREARCPDRWEPASFLGAELARGTGLNGLHTQRSRRDRRVCQRGFLGATHTRRGESPGVV